MSQTAVAGTVRIYKANMHMTQITPAWHYGRGWIFEKQKRYAAAIGEYEIAVAGDGKQPTWHYRLGYVFERLKQYKPAIDCYLRVLALDGSNAECRLHLARAYERLGQLRNAVDAYAGALAQDRSLKIEDTNIAQIKQVLRLWRFAELTYVKDDATENLEQAGIGGIARTVLANKVGRKVARTVSRVELPTPWQGHTSFIEKIYAFPENRPLLLDAFRHAELLFYICHPRTKFKTFVIPELIGMFTTSDGVVLLISDQRSKGQNGFRSTKFNFAEQAVVPLLRAISEFNLSNPLGGHETLFDPKSAQLETDRTTDHNLAWMEIARKSGIRDEVFGPGLKRFHSRDEAIVQIINDNGMAVSHNDIAPGNLLTDAEGTVAFIDFENVRMAAPGFDIGDLLVFLIRSNLAADRLPNSEAIIAFHERMVEWYVEASRDVGRNLSSESVYYCSIYAFILHILRPPKAIRTILATDSNPQSRRTIVELLLHYLPVLQARLNVAKADKSALGPSRVQSV